MKKLLEIIGILIGLSIIVYEGIRLYNGLFYNYTDEEKNNIVEEVRINIRESDILNYVNSIELNTIGEIDDETLEYNVSEYDKYVSNKTKPDLGYFVVKDGNIDSALLRYIVNNTIYYACYYDGGKTEIKFRIAKVTKCDNLKHNFE